MAEAAGLALGAIALASLVTECIECFDIIELTKTYSRDFEILETSLEAQKLRLIIWLQANGLVGPIPYNTTLNDPLIRGSIDRALRCIKLLFEDSEALRRKYSLQAIDLNNANRIPTSGQRIPVFSETYRQFRARLKNTQQSTTIGRKTKWAILDKNKFKDLVEDLKSMIDVIENMTQSAEQLQRRRELIVAEVESIIDEDHLQLVQEVASLSSDDDLSSAASRRIKLLAGTVDPERNSLVGTINNTITSQDTFYSANSQTAPADNFMTLTDMYHGNQDNERQPQSRAEAISRFRTRVQGIEYRSRDATWGTEPGAAQRGYGSGTLFAKQTTTYSSPIYYWNKRMVRELSKSQDELPLIGFAPVQASDMSYLLGHFLGPGDTPYEGGTFYVRLFIPPSYPFNAPICQFLTRVYHPNIDASGRICLDSLYDSWTPNQSIRYILLCIATLLDTPNTVDSLVPEIAATYINDRAEYDRIARLYTTKYAMADKPVLPLADESDQAKPWWQDALIRT